MLMEYSNRERMEFFYNIIAGGARLKLLESVIELKLAELVGEGTVTLEDIISKLKLKPNRAKKWVYLLLLEKFLIENRENEQVTYRLGPKLKALYHEDDTWWFCQRLMGAWSESTFEQLKYILQGGKYSYKLEWPPTSQKGVMKLKNRMARTSKFIIRLINKEVSLEESHTLLDVGGCDASIACALAQKHPHLQITVYDLPHFETIARQNIGEKNLTSQVNYVAGDFTKDNALPQKFDVVLFSRVLCDWPVDTTQKLLNMAYDSLNDHGRLIICENFMDNNHDMALHWEYIFMYWDQFTTGAIKSIAQYQNLLKEVGFAYSEFTPINDESVNRIIKAYKNQPLAM